MKKLRKININNPEELTNKGANYTIFCPIRWKQAYSPAKLRKLLKEDVYADQIKVEYIDFVQETVQEKKDQIFNIDYC